MGQQQVDFRQMMSRFSRSDMIIGGASVLLFIFMFFDWVSSSASGTFASVSAGFSGFHGWGWLTFLAMLAVVALLVIRLFLSDTVQLPDLPANDAVIFMGLGAVEVLGSLLFWIEYKDLFASSTIGTETFSVGLGFGWYVALIMGVATIVGGYLKQSEPAAAPARPSGGYTPPPSPPGGYGAPPPPSPGAGAPPPPGPSAPPPPSAPSAPPPSTPPPAG